MQEKGLLVGKIISATLYLFSCSFTPVWTCVCLFYTFFFFFAQIVPASMPEKIWMPDTEFCLTGCCTVLAFLSFAVGSSLLLSGFAFKICEAGGASLVVG